MRRCVLLLVIAIHASCETTGGDASRATPSTTSSRPSDVRDTELASVVKFENEAVGFAGLPSRGAVAFAAIYNSPDAEDRFRDLLDHGTPAARLYALTGLRAFDPIEFDRAAAKLCTRTDPVSTMRGCTGVDLPFGELVTQIDDGAWDSLVEFAKSNRR